MAHRERTGVSRATLSAVGVWEERVGRNEGLFREVNENIAKLDEQLGTGNEPMPAVCECSHADCTIQVEIAPEEYARVRQHPARFIVAPGHEEQRVEHVVEQHRGYVIVEKQGSAAAAADAVTSG
jgi:hypothetical protein